MEPLRLGRVPDPLGLGVDETEAPGANLFKSSSEAFRQDVAKRSEPKQPEFIQVADAKPASGSSFKFDLYGGGGEPAPSKPGSFKFNLYGEDTAPAPAPKPAAPEQGDTSRGFSAALGQTPALLKGAVGFAGAAGEKTFGEGGMFTALKKYGLEGYQKGMGEIEARAKETDDVTVAWKKAKEGDLGALVDWAQYGIGYLGGNVVETVGTSVLGGFIGGAMSGPAAPAGAATGAVAGAVGKEAVKGVAKNLIEGMVAKEAAKLAEKAGLETATDVMVRQATKNVAKEIGSVSALAGSSILKETGGIYGEAEEQAKKEGRELSGGDLARVFGAGVVAGLSEVAVDKLGLDVAAGKIKIPGGGRVGRAFIGGVAGIGIEGGQELFQTAVERAGAGQSLTDEDAIRDYINSFALGGLGGGTVGAISGALRSGKQDSDTVRKLLDDAQKEMSSDDGRAELYSAMMNDEKMRPILEANNIQSGDDPRFQSVITKAIATQRLLAELEPLSPEEQAAKRKEREADIQAAFGDTASTAVGSNMGATDPLIQRESVTPNEQTKELEGVAQPVSLPGTDQQSGTLAMSGEDLVSAKQGFQVLPAFSTGGEPVANRFVSLSQAETFLFGPINKETGKREGGYTSSVDDMEFQIRQGKRSKETGGGTFYFIEGRPKSGLAQQIDEAANQAATSKQNDLSQPTDAQKAAGNYKKGSIKLMGLDISIENPRGSERSGTDASGKAWRTDMAHHYGYVKGSKGKDKDHVDVFIGPNPESTKVFVVDQKNPDGSFDEHKALLGFDTIEEAQAGYLANYQQGWQGLGAISEMPADAFKSWVKDGTKKKPLAYQEPKVTATTATPTATATPKTQNNQKQQSSDIESIASEWDRSNRTSRSQEWMAGAAESNPSFNAAEQEGASVPAHGMAKVSTLGQALKDLVSMLNGGIDSSRTLYYDSLTNPSPAAGAATGTSGGVAYRDGPFIITFREGLNGRQPTSADITGVLVNPANSELVGPLQQMFPNLVVRDYKGVADVVAASRATTTQTKQEKSNATQTRQEQQGGQPKREGTGGRLEEGRNNRQEQTKDQGKGDQASGGDQSAKGGTKQETVKKTVEQEVKEKQKAKRTKVTKVEEKTEPTKRDEEQKKADSTIGKNKVDQKKVIEDWEDNDDGVSPHVAWDSLSPEAKQMWTEAVADGYNSIMTHDLIVDGEAKNARVERASKVNKPMFRQTRGGKGMSVEAVGTFVDRMVKLWKNVPTINVVQSEKDLPKPLQQFITRAEANGKVPGIYWRGEVYLIADSLADNRDVGITVMHEVAGHYGLRSILGENFGKTMDQIYNGNATVRKLADAMMQEEKLTRQEAVEEVLADMAQNREAPTRDFLVALRQIFAAIRKWARDTLGIKYMSDNDVREIVANARRFVTKGEQQETSVKPKPTESEMSVALRKMKKTIEFRKWTRNHKIIPASDTEKYKGGPAVFEAFHGTTFSNIRVFKYDTGNMQGFLGRGPYFTTGIADANENYAGMGPDIRNRIGEESERVAEEFMSNPEYAAETTLEYYRANPDEVYKTGMKLEELEKLDEQELVDQSQDNQSEIAEWEATRKVKGESDGLVMPVYVRMENPFDMRGTTGNTQLTYEVEEDKNGNIVSETGSGIEFVQAMQDLGMEWGVDVSSATSRLMDELSNGALDAKDAFDIVLRELEVDYDPMTGEAAGTGQFLQEVVRAAGYDGIVMNAHDYFGSGRRNGMFQIGMFGVEPNTLHMMPFDSNQIKSVFNERPTDNPDIMLRKMVEADKPMFRRKDYEAQYDDLPENVRNIALAKGHYSPPTIRERLESLKPDLWLRIVQGTFDRFRRVRDIDLKAYIMLRMSSATDGAVEGLLHYGRVFFDDGALNIVKGTKGLIEIMRPLGGETDRFLLWIAANRASNLAKEERERFFKPEEIKALQKLNQGSMKDGKSRYAVYAETLRQMNELNKSVLEVAKETGLIDAAAFKRFSEDIWYVPFYRQMDEDGTLSAANTSSAAVGQYLSKKLKGSERPLNDLMQNVLLNWSHILSASMKNAAANETLKAASSMGGIVSRLTQVDNRFGKDKDGNVVALKYAVKTMENGKEVYHNIEDEFLLTSLDAVASVGKNNLFIDIARPFKTTLTRLISLSPTFKINNLIRDSIQSIGLSELSGSPMGNVMQGWRAYKDKRAEALVGGGLFTLGNAFDGDRAASVKRLVAKGVDEADILTTEEKAKAWFKKFQDKYDEVSDASENANRIALYEQLRAKGVTHLEAAYAARDLQDFGLQGSWAAIRAASQILPYFNARLQGLYKLGRDGVVPTFDTLMGNADEATRQRAAKFSTVLGMVTTINLILYLSQKDDEDWKKREEWDRDSFFWFKIPGTSHIVRVPKPFEMGAFASVVERFTEQMVDSQVEGKVFGARLLSILHDNLAINPIPQMVRPLYDIARNKDGFTDRPIESMGKERLSPELRINPNTSAAAVTLGKINSMFADFASSVTGGAINASNMKLSPIQYDYLMRGYLGWLGTCIETTSNVLARPFKAGEAPSAKIDDILVIGNFVKEVPSTQSKYLTSFYENAKEISTAMADYRSYLTAGEIDKAQEYLDNKRGLIVLNKLYSNIGDKLSTISKRIEMIQDDPEMSGEEKRIEMNRLSALKIELAERAENIRIERKRGE